VTKFQTTKYRKSERNLGT